MLSKPTARLRAQQAHERELKAERLEIAKGVCESCGTRGDWRGLSLSHTKPKGMGGTRHVYSVEETKILCFKCHANNEHHQHEV